MGYFWSDLLPALRRHWRKAALTPPPSTNTDASSANHQQPHISSFPYDINDVKWAFNNYADAYGPLLTMERGMFRSCSCISSEGHRKPCIPPKVNFMCQRMATFVKMRIIRVQDKVERLWTSYKKNGLVDAMKRADHEAWSYLNSSQGKRWITNKSYEKAMELIEERGVDGIVTWKAKAADRKKKAVLAKWDRKMKKVRRARDQKIATMDTQLNKLKEDENAAKDGYFKISIQAKISTIINEKSNLPETKLLLSMQAEAEAECLAIDEALLASSSESENNLSDIASEPDTDDSSSEAERIRSRLRRRAKVKLQRDRKMELAKKYQESITKEVPKTRMQQIQFALRGINNTVTRRLEPHKEKYLKLKKSLRQALAVAEIRIRKAYLKYSGTLDEIQKEMYQELRIQYVSHEVELAKQKAVREFHCIESVRRTWGGLALETIFFEWKKYFRNRKQRERRDARVKFKVEKQAFDAAMNSVNLAQKLVDDWVQCVDIYTDELFWYNPKENELSIEPPSLEHYLPMNFLVPDPPHDLPHGVGLETSSDESEDEANANRRGRSRDNAMTKEQRQATAKKRLRKARKAAASKPSAIAGAGVESSRNTEKDGDSDDSDDKLLLEDKGDGEHDGDNENKAGQTASQFARSCSHAFRFSSSKQLQHEAEDFDDGVSALTALASLTVQIDEKRIKLQEAEDAAAAAVIAAEEAMKPPSPAIRDVKTWKPLQAPPVEAGALIPMASSRSFVSSASNSTQQSQATDMLYAYGPDSLRVGRPGLLVEPYVPPVVSTKAPEILDLHRRVAVAREYINRSAAHQVPEQRAVTALENPEVSRAVALEKAEQEYLEVTMRVKKKQREFNETRNHTYLQQRDRKPRSLEQVVQSKQGMGHHLMSENQLSHAELEAMELLHGAGAGGHASTKKGINLAPEALLKIAGGSKAMIHHAEEDGIKLRTVLATRVRIPFVFLSKLCRNFLFV
jgi:hypothetical protein